MNETTASYHKPVMLLESVDALNLHDNGVYVDVTYGGGGHSSEILRRLPNGSHLYGFDQDADAMQNVERMIESNPQGREKFTFVRSNFRYLANWMRYYGVEHVDGLIADLGVSSHHLDDSSRGFSFRFDDMPLDMRMNRSSMVSAADIVNTYDEQRMADVLYLYGELKQSRRLAAAIVTARKQKAILTTTDLVNICTPLLQAARQKKELARLFQALRIEVNHEMEALRDLLRASTQLLSPHGRLVIISYHSLEDRLVKNVMRTGNVEGRTEQDFFGRISSPYKAVNNKPILPSASEIEANPRSRSAKLRVAEHIEDRAE